MPRHGEDLVHQIPSPPRAAKDVKCPVYARGGFLSFDLTDTLFISKIRGYRPSSARHAILEALLFTCK